MTENEALNMMQAKLTCMELYDLSCVGKGCDNKCENCEYNYAQGNNGEQKEALKVAIQELEKQIPKKPKEYEDKFYACPICRNVLLHKWKKYNTELMDKSNGLPYCLGCGQKLDWSE